MTENNEEDQIEEEQKEVTAKPPIRQAVDNFYQVQEHRIAVSLQRMASEKAHLPTEFLQELEDRLNGTELFIAKYVQKEARKHPMYKWLKSVKGIGPLLAGSLLACLDPHRAPHASSFWKVCGLAVDNATGEAERRHKGEKITWNPFLKTTCYKIGGSFVKTKGEYRAVYDTSKAFYRAKFPNEVEVTVNGKKRVKYTKGHVENMSRRRTVKLFLAKFWENWRVEEGLPVDPPFAERIGAHHG